MEVHFCGFTRRRYASRINARAMRSARAWDCRRRSVQSRPTQSKSLRNPARVRTLRLVECSRRRARAGSPDRFPLGGAVSGQIERHRAGETADSAMVDFLLARAPQSPATGARACPRRVTGKQTARGFDGFQIGHDPPSPSALAALPPHYRRPIPAPDISPARAGALPPQL